METVASRSTEVPLQQAECAHLRRVLSGSTSRPSRRSGPSAGRTCSSPLALYWVAGGLRHQHGVPPAAHASRVQDVQVVRVLPRRLRHADARGRADLLGRHAPPAPSALRPAGGSAHAARQRVLGAYRLDHVRRGASQRHRPHGALRARSREGSVLPLADDVSLGAAHRARLHAAGDRRMGPRQLGDLPARGGRPAFDLAGQLGHAHVGPPPLRHERRLAQPLVGRAPHVRRGLAQQSSRPPDLRAPRPRLVRVRPHLARCSRRCGRSASSGTSASPASARSREEEVAA